MTAFEKLSTLNKTNHREPQLKIAIVGGGATAISVIDALQRDVKLKNMDVAITLYEPDKKIGPGRAYQNDGDYGLINRQARFMSVKSDDPRHFVGWVTHKYGSALAQLDFLPRHYFGEYLSDCFAEQVALARDLKRPIRVIGQKVTSLTMHDDKAVVGVENGPQQVFDRVILCIGTAEPADIFSLACSQNYIGNPYPMWTKFSAIGGDDQVAIIGSSLSAVDAVLALNAQGHRGKIVMLSRNALLPAVRMPHHDFTYKVITRERIEELRDEAGMISWSKWLGLITFELTAQGVDLEKLKVELAPGQLPFERLERHLQASARGEKWLSILIDIANDYVELAWDSLSAGDRSYYMANYHSIFMSLCNPMPPATANKLRNMLESGHLVIRPGLKGVELSPGGGFVLNYQAGACHADWVINATRSETGGVGQTGTELVSSMVNNGVAQHHPFGGLHVSFGSHKVIDRSGKASDAIYALGQLAAGNHYYTSSLAMITRQIDRVLPHLLTTDQYLKELSA